MGAPINNTNGLGNSGGKKGISGRKSAYQEMATAELLNEIFFKEFHLENIKNKIEKGTYSLKDLLLMRALQGNDRIILGIFNRIFPDKINLNTNYNYGRKSYDPMPDEDLNRLTGLFSDKE